MESNGSPEIPDKETSDIPGLPSRGMLVNHGPSQHSLKEEYKAMEKRCYRKTLRIAHKVHVTKEEVHARIQRTIGHPDHRKETQTAVVSEIRLPFVHQVWPKSSCKAQ